MVCNQSLKIRSSMAMLNNFSYEIRDRQGRQLCSTFYLSKAPVKLHIFPPSCHSDMEVILVMFQNDSGSGYGIFPLSHPCSSVARKKR